MIAVMSGISRGVAVAIAAMQPPEESGQYNPVTTAIDATGSGTRYDVTSDSELSAVPWGSLSAGDVVNIFHKATPYYIKFALRGSGTEANPIIVNGVTDASGNRPIIDGDGATTAAGCNPGSPNNIFTAFPEYGETQGAIVVKRGPSDDYNYSPKWIQIKNLQVQGAANGNSYTSLANGVINWASSAGIYFLLVEDALVENCVVTDNGFGVFSLAKDDLFSQACKRITYRNCRVYGNGVSGSHFEHNFYVQCANPIIEGCYIGQVRAGSLGSSYKSRASGEIFRYNFVEGSARVCDWVHSEDQVTDGISQQADYPYVYAYGNVFSNDHTLPQGGAAFALHLGGDNLGEDNAVDAFINPSIAYKQHMYFWHNTFVTRGNTASDPYRATIFDLSLASNNPNTGAGAPTTVDAWNNVFVYVGVTAPPTVAAWVEFGGVLNLHGNNAAYGVTDSARDGANSDRYEINAIGTLITTDPALADIANQDYRLGASSPARNQATDPAAMAAVIAAHPVQYQPRIKSNGMTARSTTNDLGAMEHAA